MDIKGQQDQHTPLGTATACISEWLLEYSMEQHGLRSEEPPGNRKPKYTPA